MDNRYVGPMENALPRLVPLGDRAAIAYWATEAEAQAFARHLLSCDFPGLEEAVPAYASVGVFFDIRRTSPRGVFAALGDLMREFAAAGPSAEFAAGRTHVIPCCYELALDMGRVCDRTRLSVEEVIRLHTGTTYTVHAIGFTPGFPYLGYLPEELREVPRLDTPRLQLEPGSVGLTGKQTGIYPSARPGGWNIVGRTPLVLADAQEGYFPIEVGDTVRFERIDRGRFAKLKGKRLGG